MLNTTVQVTPTNAPSEQSPLITVAICTHNRAALMAEAVHSVLPQLRGDTELVIVDNSSTDDTAEDGWLEAYRRFFSGLPSARVAGAGGAVFPRYEKPPPAWLNPRAHLLDWGDEPRAFAQRGGPWGCNFAVHRRRAIE